ncbi:MAG: desulfoferrodoxin [Defluviitaleaceae bacterium]|nr:desulfoferrodoxin [Defluviitaleaceae bacterium]
MCKGQKFYKCGHCGNLMGLIKDKGVPMMCCGEKMAELVPNTVEASAEKHLPVVSSETGTCDCGRECICLDVKVGSATHPMDDGHHISFVYVETERGGQRKCLKAGEEPRLPFCVTGDKPVAVYAYCNLHGLWKTEIE